MDYKIRKHLIFMLVFAMILSMNVGTYAEVYKQIGLDTNLKGSLLDEGQGLSNTSGPAIGVDDDLDENEMGENLDGLSKPEYIDAPYIEKASQGEMNKIAMPRMMMRLAGPTEGPLVIDKKAKPFGETTNQWEINLNLWGPDVSTADVVLVIDRSGSMKDSPMTSAKNAAKQFVKKLLDDKNEKNIRIAVVSFASGVSLDSNFKDVNGKEELNTAIDGLKADGGTFIQSGIRQARALLKDSKADSKNIVLLGDGAATYSYKIEDPDDYATEVFDPSEYGFGDNDDRDYRTTSNVKEEDFEYKYTVGGGSQSHTRYDNGSKEDRYYRHGASSIAEAGFAKDEGFEIYAIALNTDFEGKWTLDGISSSGKADTASNDDLDDIFDDIAGSVSYSATDATIIDPMGEEFSIPGIDSSNYKDKITVSRGEISWNNDTETITWTLDKVSASKSKPETMTYIVEIDDDASKGTHLTNKETSVEYKIDDESYQKIFPYPEVNVEVPDKYTVTFDSKGGSNVDPIGNIEKDATIELPEEPVKDGFIFNGWYKDEESLKNEFTAETTVTDNITVYAKWTAEEVEPATYIVTFDSKGGSNVDPIGNIEKGATIELPDAPVKDGYIFGGWFTDEESLENEFTAATTVTDNITVYTKWTAEEVEPVTYIVTFDSKGGSNVDPIGNIEKDATIELPDAPVKDGYIFGGWFTDEESLENEFTAATTVTDNITVYAKWTATSSGGGGGGGTGGGSGGGSGGGGRTETIDEEIPEALPLLNKEDHFQYIQGYPDNTVRPEGKVTREEVAAVFYRLLASDYRESIKTLAQGFNDVNETRWSTKHIATLANGKIVDGYLDGSFKPGNYITRAELATIASRFDNLSTFESNSFSDVDGHWASEYINSAAQKGWVNGYPDGTFKPNQEITRAEFVTLVNNVLDRRVKKENILEDARKFSDLEESKWYYEAMQEAINSHLYTRLEDSFEKWEEINYPEIDM